MENAPNQDSSFAATRPPRPWVKRGSGSTPSERYLQRLAERSFLKFWSHPCVFQDDVLAKLGQGRELCDLLVVFGNDILIFSDKDCEFPAEIDEKLAWRRWFRRTVLAGAKQIWGAERWIKTFPNRLYLDSRCSRPFPFKLPSPSSARFHRIVVAHGASGPCAKHFGGSGSLMIDSHLVHNDNSALPSADVRPFTIGQIDLTKGYVHVFDDTTLDVVMQTLDTATDFVAYLVKKEAFISRMRTVAATGEEELLAFYLQKGNAKGEHDFVVPSDINAIFLEEGHWEEFCKSQARLAQLEANRTSYLWDTLIEKFSHHIMEGTQYWTCSNGPHESEISLRFLAKESRTRRRMLGAALLEVVEKANAKVRYTRVYRGLLPGEPYYVLLALPSTHAKSEAEYREVRRLMLQDYCAVCKHMWPDAQDVIGVAISPTSEASCSEDLMYFDAREWTSEQDAYAKQLKTKFGYLSKIEEVHGKLKEYPDRPDQLPRPRINVPRLGRNEQCYCGSGRKFKKCCGRF